MKVVPQGGKLMSYLLPLFFERSEARLFMGDPGEEVVARLGHGRRSRRRRADSAGALPEVPGSAARLVCVIGEIMSQSQNKKYTRGACDIHKNLLYWCISSWRFHKHGKNQHRNRRRAC